MDAEMGVEVGGQVCWAQGLREPNQEPLLFAECCCADCGILS